ncbi:hypothetical protein AGMMS49975_23910 [Clostridia bacterium]|nr:hypothetical protein AGMMS49975_23910 [Clostridia bacterium]
MSITTSLRRAFAFALVLLFCLWTGISPVHADTSKLVFSVSPSVLPTAGSVNVGQDLLFDVTVKNTDVVQTTVQVMGRGGWVRSLIIPPGESGVATMYYKVAATDNGTGSLVFNFTVTENLLPVAAVGSTEFVYSVVGVGNVTADVQVSRNQKPTLGGIMSFDVYLRNTGNTQASSITINHALDPYNNTDVGLLMPGESRTYQVWWTIPTSMPANQNLTDSFTIRGTGFSPVKKEISFVILGFTRIDTSYTVNPNNYVAGDKITISIAVSNTGDVPCENLIVTNSEDTRWKDTIAYLAVNGTVNSRYSYVVPSKSRDITFYIDDANRNSVAQVYVRIDVATPVEKETIKPTPVPEVKHSLVFSITPTSGKANESFTASALTGDKASKVTIQVGSDSPLNLDGNSAGTEWTLTFKTATVGSRAYVCKAVFPDGKEETVTKTITILAEEKPKEETPAEKPKEEKPKEETLKESGDDSSAWDITPTTTTTPTPASTTTTTPTSTTPTTATTPTQQTTTPPKTTTTTPTNQPPKATSNDTARLPQTGYPSHAPIVIAIVVLLVALIGIFVLRRR